MHPCGGLNIGYRPKRLPIHVAVYDSRCVHMLCAVLQSQFTWTCAIFSANDVSRTFTPFGGSMNYDSVQGRKPSSSHEASVRPHKRTHATTRSARAEFAPMKRSLRACSVAVSRNFCFHGRSCALPLGILVKIPRT